MPLASLPCVKCGKAGCGWDLGHVDGAWEQEGRLPRKRTFAERDRRLGLQRQRHRHRRQRGLAVGQIRYNGGLWMTLDSPASGDCTISMSTGSHVRAKDAAVAAFASSKPTRRRGGRSPARGRAYL